MLIIFNSWISIGGGGIHTMKIAEALSKCNNVTIFIPKLGYDSAKKFLKNTYNVNTIVYSTPFEKHNHFNMYFIYFSRLIKSILLSTKSKNKYNVIISNSQLLFDLIPAIVFKIKNKSVLIVYFHHGNPCIKKEISIGNIISRTNFLISIILCKIFADLIFAINEPIKNYIVDRGINAEKVVLTNNGVDIERINSFRSYETEYEAVFLGRIDKIKGAYDLIESWKIVTKKYPFAKLCIIGGGPDQKSINIKIRENNLVNNIVLAGKISDDEKYQLMKKSKVFVYPSHQESWGIVIAEAIACGLPVIAYDLPVYRDIFYNHINTIEMLNERKMGEKIIEILENYNEFKNIADKGKKFIIKFDWRNIQRHELRHIEGIV